MINVQGAAYMRCWLTLFSVLYVSTITMLSVAVETVDYVQQTLCTMSAPHSYPMHTRNHPFPHHFQGVQETVAFPPYGMPSPMRHVMPASCRSPCKPRSTSWPLQQQLAVLSCTRGAPLTLCEGSCPIAL